MTNLFLLYFLKESLICNSWLSVKWDGTVSQIAGVNQTTSKCRKWWPRILKAYNQASDRGKDVELPAFTVRHWPLISPRPMSYTRGDCSLVCHAKGVSLVQPCFSMAYTYPHPLLTMVFFCLMYIYNISMPYSFSYHLGKHSVWIRTCRWGSLWSNQRFVFNPDFFWAFHHCSAFRQRQRSCRVLRFSRNSEEQRKMMCWPVAGSGSALCQLQR